MKARKPSVQPAMQDLLVQIRHCFPFDQPAASLCQQQCVGCPKKLMEYLQTEVADWQAALDRGEQPTLGDIQRLANTSRKIGVVMKKNGLIS